MSISNRDKGILLGLLGFVLAVLSYVLVFNPMTLKNETLKTELATLKTREAELLELESNLAYYKEQIVLYNNHNQEMVAKFPAEVKPESEIMYAVELEDQLDVEFSSLNYGTPVEIAAVGGAAEAAPEGEAAAEPATAVTAYCTPLSATYNATYQGLKDVILHTADKTDRLVVDTVTASYDSTTGNLVGSMTINMYTVSGTERMYKEPYVPAMFMGTDNIFGTIEIPANQDSQDTQETAGN